MNRMKLAELTSGIGALVLGIGIGSLFAEWFGGVAGLITIVGLMLHAFGMWDKHRFERSLVTTNPAWVVALYWICWALLAALVAVLIVGRR
jgi:hypothetical protein